MVTQVVRQTSWVTSLPPPWPLPFCQNNLLFQFILPEESTYPLLSCFYDFHKLNVKDWMLTRFSLQSQSFGIPDFFIHCCCWVLSSNVCSRYPGQVPPSFISLLLWQISSHPEKSSLSSVVLAWALLQSSSLPYSGSPLVNCPTRWSLLFIFGFLCWSSHF